MTNPSADPRVQRLADRYTNEAQAYDEYWAPVLKVLACALFHKLPAISPSRILDVGTGVGTFLPVLRESFPGAAVCGIDRSVGMLERISDQTPCAVMDASQLAVGTATVDLVTLVFMIFHLPDPLEGLREARRVLRNGGYAATVTWAGDFDSAATELWDKQLDLFEAGVPDPSHLAQHELVDTPEKMAMLMAEVGFDTVEASNETRDSVIDMDHLCNLRTGMGRNGERFRSLSSGTQKEFLESTREKLAVMSDSDFICRGDFVYCVGGVTAE